MSVKDKINAVKAEYTTANLEQGPPNFKDLCTKHDAPFQLSKAARDQENWDAERSINKKYYIEQKEKAVKKIIEEGVDDYVTIIKKVLAQQLETIQELHPLVIARIKNAIPTMKPGELNQLLRTLSDMQKTMVAQGKEITQKNDAKTENENNHTTQKDGSNVYDDLSKILSEEDNNEERMKNLEVFNE